MANKIDRVTCDTFISKDDTKMLKAIAVILMIMHHLWYFPDRIAGGTLNYVFTVFGKPLTVYMGHFGKICVSMFFFLGGYGVYLSSRNKKFNIIGKIKNLYFEYWKVFVIFIPIGFIFFSSQSIYCKSESICTKYAHFSAKDFLSNFFGISSSYNGEWWFLISYAFALFSFPIIRGIIDKKPPRVNILLVIVSSIIVTNLLPALGSIQVLGNLNKNYLYSKIICQKAPYISCFWMGVVFAKDALFDRMNKEMKDNNLVNPIADIFMVLAVIFLRQSGPGDKLDIFYVPVLIMASMDLVGRVKIVRKILLAIGVQSTNMWLIHSFFCYYFYEAVKIVTWTRWAVPSLLSLLVMTYIASVLLSLFWKLFEKMYVKVKTKFRHVNSK